jgi:quercetin dioxygenase-like cupin family protein
MEVIHVCLVNLSKLFFSVKDSRSQGSIRRQGGTAFRGSELSEKLLIMQVNFGLGVRNKFHSHTVEQVLIVTQGKRIVATEKEEISVVPGDVIFIPPGEKHWHGAAKGATFSHLYIMSPDAKTTQLEP